MDESNSQRRLFQFDLRKLMIWTAVWSVYLSFVRWAIRSATIDEAVVFSVYLPLLAAVRIRHGYQRGTQFAVFAIGPMFVFALAIIFTIHGLEWGGVFGFFRLLWLYLLGLLFGFLAFVLVHAVVRAVDWLDNLMATKPPQEQ